MIPRRRRASTVSVGWEDSDGESYTVECSVSPGDPGCTYGPPERCYPPEPPEVEVLRVFDEDGKERPDLVAAVEADLARIEAQAIEDAEESHLAAYEDACERRAEERREDWR